MNTSSSRGSTSRHDSSSNCGDCDRGFQRSAIRAGDMEGAAEYGRRFDARHAAQRARRGVDILAGRLEGDEAGVPRDILARPLHDDMPVGEIDDAVAALGLVHVVGGDQHREALARHVVDHVPEFAPRLGVDARGRLVQQQQLRLVEHAGGERQALLPPSGQLPGQLVAAIGEAHALASWLRPPRARRGIS